jgi:hypothetical protein
MITTVAGLALLGAESSEAAIGDDKPTTTERKGQKDSSTGPSSPTEFRFHPLCKEFDLAVFAKCT